MLLASNRPVSRGAGLPGDSAEPPSPTIITTDVLIKRSFDGVGSRARGYIVGCCHTVSGWIESQLAVSG